MLEAEERLMVEVNKAGAGLTGDLLHCMDADGRPITHGGRRMTAKRRKEVRHVETPYGCVVVERWAYQDSRGGSCHYPMDYHSSGYVCAAAGAFAHETPKGEDASTWWANEACSHLKHEEGAAAGLLEIFEARLTDKRRIGKADREALERAATYFRNNVDRMDYARYTAEGRPTGSGVTEAGCKLIIKKRFCGPGMTWGFRATRHLMRLRALAHSAGDRWNSMWDAILTSKAA